MNNHILVIDQGRSFVECIISSEVLEKVYAFMAVDERIYVHFQWANGLVWSSIPDHTKKIILTREKRWTPDHSLHSSYLEHSKDAVGFVICRSSSNDGHNNTLTILQEWLRKCVRENYDIYFV